MKNSLLTDLKTLVYNGESGVLTVDHKFGNQAKVYIEEGLIAGIVAGNTTGTEAAKLFGRWISVTSHFSKQKITLPKNIKSVETSSFLSALEKVAASVEKLKDVIPSYDTCIKIDMEKSNTDNQFSSQELKIALLLDGTRSVEQVISESGQPELEVLAKIYKLCNLGIARIFKANKPMKKQACESFLKNLQETLSELVGPVADVLLDDAFEKIGIQPDSLSETDIPLLLNTIGAELGEKERAVLGKLSG